MSYVNTVNQITETKSLTYVHRVSKKQLKLISLELRQISINFDNFWHKDGQDNRIVYGVLIFHLT